MLHYKNLYKLFFESFPNQATEFIALSGFVGLEPIIDLADLPFNSKIIFGLQKESQKLLLHEKLLELNSETRTIFYPEIACHSKCYLWLNGQTPIKGLIGSANFSSNGLRNDYRETLLEVDQNQLYVLKGYIEIILSTAKECNLVRVVEQPTFEEYNKEVCEMVLYDPRTGQTQIGHGLNWGLANAHVRANDACIPIRVDHILKYPKLFPPLQPNLFRKRGGLQEVIEFVWDDGEVMQCRLEGSQPIAGQQLRYPKQIASFPNKDVMGKYIRNRLGVPLNNRIMREDLIRYGRDTVSVSLIEEGLYFFDFSV